LWAPTPRRHAAGARGLVLGHVDAAIGDRHRNQDLAQHDLRRGGELAPAGLVQRPHLVVGDADLLEHLNLLYLPDEQVAFDRDPELGLGHALRLQRRPEGLVAFQVVGRPDVVDDLPVARVGQRPAVVLRALQQQQFVHRGQDQGWRRLGNRLRQARAVGRELGQLGPLAKRRHLALLEVAERHDVAVDLH
jgi:hypothetical protein